jgi:tetratricopeptide (TPR) repeat protein
VLAQVGFVAFEQSEPAAAGQYFAEALQIAEELKDRKLQTRVFINLAMFEAGVNGDLGKAEEYYRRTIEVAREIGDRTSESTAFGNLGFVSGLQGNFQDARVHLERALESARESGELYDQIFLLSNLSANAGIQNEPATAAQYAEKAISMAQKAGERSGEAWGWLYLGHAHLLMDELEQAKTAFHHSVRIREELGQTALSMEPLAGLLEAGLCEGDLELASDSAERILAHLNHGGTLNGTDEPLRVFFQCFRLLEKKQDPRATQVLQDAMQMLEAQLANLKDERSRELYVENVPWRSALKDAATKTR